MCDGVVEHAMKHAALVEYLETLHPPPAWVFLTEVRSRAGYHAWERYIDAFAMSMWPSMKHLRVAYEVKSSRSDWLRELRLPRNLVRLRQIEGKAKCEHAVALSNRFYFVLAEGVWRPQDRTRLPKNTGVKIVRADGRRSRNVVRAPTRQVGPMPAGFVAMLLRAAKRECGCATVELKGP